MVADVMPNYITAPRETIAWNLEAYGETELASQLLNAPDDVLFRTWVEAFNVMASDPKRRMIDNYLARGAVKALTGSDRPLRRQTRRFVTPEPTAEISPQTHAAWRIWNIS
jgi:hypothetical protein